jgi:hypothetical protein
MLQVEKLQRLMTESEACATQSNYNEVCKVWTGIEMVALLANHGIGVTDIVYYQVRLVLFCSVNDFSGEILRIFFTLVPQIAQF